MSARRLRRESIACPDGGKYLAVADGNLGVCSHHGHAHYLRPCCETPVMHATAQETRSTPRSRRTTIGTGAPTSIQSPSAFRSIPRRYGLETIVLPLIDNSIYTGLAAVLGGKPEPLESLPVPKGNIFIVNFRLNKEALETQLRKAFSGERSEEDQLAEGLAFLAAAQAAGLPAAHALADAGRLLSGPTGQSGRDGNGGRRTQETGSPQKEARKLTYRNFRKFLFQGLGNQIGFHVYDAEPHVDFNLPRFFGDMIRLSNNQGDMESLVSFFLFLFSSANSPAYLSVAVQDTASGG